MELIINYEEVYNDSLTRLRFKWQEFLDEFYNQFISQSDEIKEKFKNTDMDTQKKMLTKSFNFMFDLFSRKEMSTFLLNTAKSHSMNQRNISPILYDLWMECLISALKKYDTQFNENVELAWHLVMAPGIAFMKFHYHLR